MKVLCAAAVLAIAAIALQGCGGATTTTTGGGSTTCTITKKTTIGGKTMTTTNTVDVDSDCCTQLKKLGPHDPPPKCGIGKLMTMTMSQNGGQCSGTACDLKGTKGGAAFPEAKTYVDYGFTPACCKVMQTMDFSGGLPPSCPPAKSCMKITMTMTKPPPPPHSFMEKITKIPMDQLAEFSFSDEGKGADQGWAPEQGWISMLAVAVSAGVAGAVGMFMMFQARQRFTMRQQVLLG